MDYLKTYKSFINSHYLSEGIRITAGVVLPALAFSYFNMFAIGIVVSLGALFVSITDSPGPVHHRKNGMSVCILAIFIATLIIGFAVKSYFLLAIFLFTGCFFFSMISVYGARPGSIGTAVMIVMTLTVDPRLNLDTPSKVIVHSALLVAGGTWYMCFSMLLYNFRPYRLLQQALGDAIQATAQYLLIRSEFYKKEVDYENTFKQLLQQQATVQHKQNEMTELLFKTRSIVKESTNIGRSLVMIHLDVVDIFERIMMSHQQYPLLHQYFDNTNILNDYYHLAHELANDLDDLGIAVKSGEHLRPRRNLNEQISKITEKLDQLRLTYLKPDNIEGFISLRRILENIQDLAERLEILQQYTNFNGAFKKRKIKGSDYKHLISSQQITPGLFFSNLTLKSDSFRHSMRVSIAIVTGFVVAAALKIGHSYWVLLTIVVILKPAFSLSKQRNSDRLAGTFSGIIVALIILYLFNNTIVLFAFLVVFMAGGYTFMRTNYFISVLLMTVYLLIFYHLLNPNDFKILLKDRIVDTLIGSFIAFIASIFLLPSWERKKFKSEMVTMLSDVRDYFSVIADAFSGKQIDPSAKQLARKNALVALANLSDAFNRMISEPKRQQQGIETLHQFVVLNHMLTSYIATLAHYIQMQTIPYSSVDFIKVSEDIQQHFTNAISYLNGEDVTEKTFSNKGALRKLNERVKQLMQKRVEELQQGKLETDTRKPLFDLKSIVDQFNLIYNVAIDLNKITQTLKIE
ncbi:MAG: FUSC family protein [Bacteroidota bacterium]|nr:FUSC family protein [Bacteroidota bacterium]